MMFIFFVFLLLLNQRVLSKDDGSWRKLENFTKQWITQLAKETENEYKSVLNELPLSDQCHGSLENYIQQLATHDLNAIKMFDSSGKIPSGLLQGTWTDLGAFDECISLPSSQYCFVQGKMPLPSYRRVESFLRPYSPDEFDLTDPNLNDLTKYAHFFAHINITIGVCLPLGCSIDQLRSIVRVVLGIHDTGMIFDVDSCQTRSEPISLLTREMVALLIIFTVIILNIAGSLFPKTSFLCHFDLSKNVSKVFSRPLHGFTALNGIKTLSMIYLIMGHTNMALMYNSVNNLFNIPSDMKSPFYAYTLLVPLVVDTFFIATGLEMMTFFINFKSSFNVASYLFIRWARFAVTIGWMICLNIIIFSDYIRTKFGGPFWHNLYAAYAIPETCGRKWLQHIFLIAHYFETPSDWRTCLMVDWYLEVDFVLAILFLFVLIPFLSRKRKCSICIAFIIIAFGHILTASLISGYDLLPGPSVLDFMGDEFTKLLVFVHFKPWNHSAAYFIGVLLAFTLESSRMNISSTRIKIGWSVCLLIFVTLFTIMVIGVYGLFPINNGAVLFFQTTYITFWSLAMSWFIFATHYNLIWSWINHFLSSTILAVMSRVSLNAMFINALVIRWRNATLKSTFDFSVGSMYYYVQLPTIVHTYLLSFLFACIVDKPLSNIVLSWPKKPIHDDKKESFTLANTNAS